MDSLFFRLNEIHLANATMTGMQREMLRMTLEANPGVTLGVAVKDVYDYLKIKLKKGRLEAICYRLIEENERNQQLKPPEERNPEQREEGLPPPPKRKMDSAFGKELIKWIEEMHAADRLLVALDFDAEKARQIYVEQDYLVTDTICTLFLEEKWNDALIQLQAAAAPWMGGKGGKGGEIEQIDLTGENDAGWEELGKLLGGG